MNSNQNYSVEGSSARKPEKRELFYIKPTVTLQTAKLKIAAYARVSSASDDQQNSFSAQVRHYTAMITANEKWELADIYADEAVTGTSTEKRDDFNRMLSDCRKGKIDRIITKSTSRFARNTLDSLQASRDLKELGVSVFFEKEGIDTEQISSEVLLTLYSAFAQDESQNLAQNKKMGNRMQMRNGTYVPSCVPYGYRLVDKLPHIHEQEAEVVKRIFKEYLAGYGTREIAKHLSADNIPRKDGGAEWRSPAIVIIIRNERYIGDMLLQKTFFTDTLPYQTVINHGELDQYYLPETHEPIIDRVQFKLANILLAERSIKSQSPPHEFSLSKKIRCGECGTLFRRKVSNDKIYWVCRRHDEDRSYCDSERIPESEVYSAFIRLYNKLKASYTLILPTLLSQLEKMQDLRTRNNPEIFELNKQIANLQEQNHVMNGLMSKGILDSALFISQNDELCRRIKALKLAKSRLINAAEDENVIERTEDLIGILEDGPEHIGAFDQTLFTDMVKGITVNGNALAFELINGLTLTEKTERTVR